MILNKMAYLKIKKIILNEYKKGYYDNAANIKEIIDLDSYDSVDENDIKYRHIENMVIYQNNMVSFNSFDRYMECNYVVLPAYLWNFKDEPKQNRKSKRYVKNRKYK